MWEILLRQSTSQDHIKGHTKLLDEGIKYSCDQCDYQTGRKDIVKKHKKQCISMKMQNILVTSVIIRWQHRVILSDILNLYMKVWYIFVISVTITQEGRTKSKNTNREYISHRNNSLCYGNIVEITYGNEHWNMEMNTEIWKWILKYGNEHWNMEMNTEIWKWTLKYGNELWKREMNTEIWKWTLKYGNEHN